MTPNYVYIPSADWSTLTVDSSTQRQYTVNDDIKHPRVDEFNVAYEQMFGRDYKLTATVHQARLEELRQQHAAGSDLVGDAVPRTRTR